MNIDFIKWMVEKAEGFEMGINGAENCIICPVGSMHIEHHQKTDDWHKTIYPLLLQRAIEGVNSADSTYFIGQGRWYINAWNETVPPEKAGVQVDIRITSPDQAKEKALMYVNEQEATQ